MRVDAEITIEDRIETFVELGRLEASAPTSRMTKLKSTGLLALFFAPIAGALTGHFPVAEREIKVGLIAALGIAALMILQSAREIVRPGKTFDGAAVAKRVRAMFESGRYRAETGPCSFGIDATGLSIVNDLGSLERSWAGIDAVLDVPSQIIMTVGRASGFAIPKRAFANPAEAQAFLEAARRFHAEAQIPAGAAS